MRSLPPEPHRPRPLRGSRPGWERSGWGWGATGSALDLGAGAAGRTGRGSPCEAGTLQALRGEEVGSARTDQEAWLRSPRALTACVHSPRALRTGRGLPEGPGDRKALWRQKPPPRRASSLQGLPAPRFRRSRRRRSGLSVLTVRGTPDVVKRRRWQSPQLLSVWSPDTG